VGYRTFEHLLASGVNRRAIQYSVCHQVGSTHRRMMLEKLGLSEQRDYSTFSWLGNTGSVALPTALAMGLRGGFITADSQVALLGIGSGINSIMMMTHWHKPIVAGHLDSSAIARISTQCDSTAVAS